MKNALVKDTFREIKKSFGRFLSIFAIVAIGVAFFSGVKASAPIMKYTADKYFDDYNLMDIRVLSTLGLTDEDINSIKDIEGVNGVFPTHSIDALTTVNSTEKVLKIHGISLDKIDNENEDFINRPVIVEGRYPEKSGECLIEYGKIDEFGLEIGDKITLTSGTSTDISESINTNEYTIVGKASSPYYLSFEKGTSAIGNGYVSNFIIIPEEDFKSDIYTEVFLTVDGARDINSYKDDYFEVIDKVTAKLEDLSKVRGPLRFDELKSESNIKLEEGREEYLKNKEKFETEITKASQKIEDSKVQIANGEAELKKKEEETNKLLLDGEKKVEDGFKALEKGELEYLDGVKRLEEVESNLKVLEAALGNNVGKKNILTTQLNELKNSLNNSNLNPEQIEGIKIQIMQLEKVLENIETLEKGKIEIANSKITIQNTRKLLDNTKLTLNKEKENLATGKVTASEEIEKAKESLSKGRVELEDGIKEYNRNKTLGEEELAKAEDQLLNSEKLISELEPPEWFVLDRNSHYSYVDYGGSADRIDAIAKVFPVFFFLVAALVCLTTMTRMVDEQRINIGTMKALGYSKVSIASKYIFYAASASIAGSIVGIIIGFTVFPFIIYNAYGIMYVMPSITLRFDWILALLSTLSAVSITTFAAIFACYKELVETPSLLMRAKAPKEGKRILLERITFLWKRFSFTEKVTARNIFRYKKRFFMTVIGISGCTALLLAGFGIKDSIKTIVDKQFGEIFKYDVTINLDKESSLVEIDNTVTNLSKDTRFTELMLTNRTNITITGEDGKDITVNLVVPSDVEKYKGFTELRTRVGQKEIEIENDGVVISEKLANKLGVTKGDVIEIDNGDTHKYNVKISGISENYIDLYMFMSKDYYHDIFSLKPDFNRIIGKLEDTSKKSEDTISKELMQIDTINSVSFFSGIASNFNDTISSLNYVVIVLIISAGSLAFVVLYNLTNVNVSERLREIATIKVLGFYDNEVSAYVYRENLLLTAIGTIVGLGLGTILHRFIMITVELDTVMFGRNIDLLSYLYGAALTILFAVFVNLVMYYKLKNIPMVESLKSVD